MLKSLLRISLFTSLLTCCDKYPSWSNAGSSSVRIPAIVARDLIKRFKLNFVAYPSVDQTDQQFFKRSKRRAPFRRMENPGDDRIDSLYL